MSKKRSLERDKAFIIYKKNKGNITNREIAAELNISEKTISVWKYRDRWKEKLNEVLQNNKQNLKKNKIKSSDITDKQELFCLYYIESFNATKSYQKAFKCSYNVANSEGYKLLVNPCIKEKIDSLKNDCLEEIELNSKYLCKCILQKYIDIAFSDLGDYISFGQKEIKKENSKGELETFNVNYVDLKDSRQVDTSLISEVSCSKNGVSIKLHDKLKALEFLSKYLGLIDLETKEKLGILKDKLELDKEKFEYTKHKIKEYEEDGTLKDMLEGFNDMLKQKEL